MFTFEICNKAIKQVNLIISQVSSRKGHRNIIMVTYIKGGIVVLIKYNVFNYISQVSVARFL